MKSVTETELQTVSTASPGWRQPLSPSPRPGVCKGERCMSTDGFGHSRECIAEAGRNQGWIPTAEDFATAGPSAPLA